MHRTIGHFVSALRQADLAVSPAETLDAMAALEIIGVRDKRLVHDTLSIVLAKTLEEKEEFDRCFERFFSFNQFSDTRFLSGRQIDLVGPDPETEDRQGEDKVGHAVSAPANHPASKRRKRRQQAHQLSRLAELILTGDQAGLSLALLAAAKRVSLSRIKTLRERGLYSQRILVQLGINQLNDDINSLSGNPESPIALVEELKQAKSYIIREVRQFVEEQYYLLVDASGSRFITESLMKTRLTNAHEHYYDRVKDTVRKLAHQLAKQHARRKRVVNRGQMDIRRTIRKNVAYDGSLVEIQWKRIKRQRPRIFILCDVSGSVKNVSRFLLTFVYSLNEVLPQLRSFVFANEFGEVSEYFSGYRLEEAIAMSLEDYGKGSTDYGQAFHHFEKQFLADVDSKSTIIILGDSRNNYYGNGVKSLLKMYKKCRQLIWLNPEDRSQWRTGDAEMSAYLPACHAAIVCNSLADLQKIATRMLGYN